MKRPHIIQFLENVEWATSRNINILKNGYYNHKDKTIVAELYAMTKTKRVPALKRIKEEGVAIFTYPESKRKSIDHRQFYHDKKLRDCLAKIAHEKGLDVFTANDKTADGIYQNIYIEFDSGKKSLFQLMEQMRYYKGKGFYQVLFIAGHRDGEYHEKDRMKKMLNLASPIFKEKKGRFLVTTYSEFIDNFKVWTLKGAETTL